MGEPESEETPEDTQHETRTISVHLLKILYEGPPVFTAKQLAEASGLQPSNVYRRLYTLEKMGWVERIGRRTGEAGSPETVWKRVHRLAPIEVDVSFYMRHRPVHVRQHKRRV